MQSRAIFSVLVLVACTGALLCSRTAESQDKPQTPRDDRINRLLVERQETLRQLLDAVMDNYTAGSTTVDNVIRAQNGLLDAELELAKTNLERIRIHEKRVKNLQYLENVVKERHAAGEEGGTTEMMLGARAARLKAEIELLREQVDRD